MAQTLPKIPAAHWLFKNGKVFMDNPLGFCLRHREAHGDIFEMNTPVHKNVLITEPEYIKYVLVTNNKNYIKDRPTRMLRLGLGNGLLTSEGDFWRRQRRIAQPAFHKKKVAGLLDIMVAETHQMLKAWEQKPKEIDLAWEMNRLTSSIAAKSLFGAEIEGHEAIGKAMENSLRFITQRFFSPINLPMWFPSKSILQFKRQNKILDTLIYGIIEKRRKAQADHNDLLSMLMAVQDEETGEKMSDLQLRDECMTLFTAGHETTANALSWTFYLLMTHPKIMAKLEAEVQEKLPKGRLDFAAIHALSYTSQVVSESMRLYPPAWTIGREAINDDEIGGYHIPKGSNLLMHIYTVHRRGDLWKDPTVFLPERFAKGSPKPTHRYAYFPFGGGPRQCIGSQFALMELQIILPMILQRVSLSLVQGQRIEPEALVTLRPKYGIRVKKNFR